MNNPQINVCTSNEMLAEQLVSQLAHLLTLTPAHRNISLALSGGSTPEKIFRIITEKYANRVQWRRVNFFWGDERCVPPDHQESNFMMTLHSLLNPLAIPGSQIFRVKGELPPQEALADYRKVVASNVSIEKGLPCFDLMILGLGDDGHTASIFPGDDRVIQSDEICEIASHPQSGQQRVSLTLPVINNSRNIVFLVTGAGKAEMVHTIIKGNNASVFPAAMVKPLHGSLLWLMDEEAAARL